jgi:Peptidase A4 family
MTRATFAGCALLGVLAFGPAAARAAISPPPVIVSLSVWAGHGQPLAAAGERVVVSVRVRNATSCEFLAPRSAFSLSYPLKTVPCASGQASLSVAPIPNTYQTRASLHYAVIVRGAGGRTTQRTLMVAESAAATTETPTAPSPPVASLAATLTVSPSSLPSTGGPVALTYSAAGAATCTLSSSPALWTGANPATVNCSGTYSSIVPASSIGQQWTIIFTATSLTGQAASSSQTLVELAPVKAQPPPGSSTSTNWSGYVIPSTSSIFTEASGTWTVPSLNCASTPDGGASTWVGIGGVGWPTGGSSGVLLQTGVTTDCGGGVQKTYGWFEEFPSNPNHLAIFNGFPVSPGDTIEATVFQGTDGSTWETQVDDLSTGLSGVMVTGGGWGVSQDAGNGSFFKQGSTLGLSYQGGYTAEWIVEAYTANDAVVTLANYGSVSFSGLTTSLPWSLKPNEAETLVQGGVAVSTPSAPLPDGGFSVSYTG